MKSLHIPFLGRLIALAASAALFVTVLSYLCHSLQWYARFGQSQWTEVLVFDGRFDFQWMDTAQSADLDWLAHLANDGSGDLPLRSLQAECNPARTTMYSFRWLPKGTKCPYAGEDMHETTLQVRFSMWALVGTLGFISTVRLAMWVARRRNRDDLLRCANCEYCLIGLEEPRCPECGLSFVVQSLPNPLRNGP